MKAKIRAYPMNGSLRSRLDYGDYYAIQSQADKTMMYVFEKDEVAVITPDVAIRIPVDLFREIADIADDYNDLKRRRVI